jgi:ubiquinone/menaquinone biosynthesis C-methylase UbiE
MSKSPGDFLNPQSFDPVAAEYDFAASLNPDHEFILAHLSVAKGDALEIGCGSGLVACALAQHYARVVGIDSSAQMLQIAQHKRPAPNLAYVQMDAERMALRAQFDFILSVNTLHHVQPLASAFEAFKRLLKPMGRIILIDVISERETPPAWVYRVGAFQQFIPDVSRHGLQTALRLFRFHTSKPWLQHLATDRYLSARRFREIYGSAFTGCEFVQFGAHGMAMIWSPS